MDSRVTAFAHLGVIAVLHFQDEAFGVYHLCCAPYFLICGLRFAIADIVCHGAAEKVRALQHISQVALQPQLAALAVIHAVDTDAAFRGLIKAAHQVHDGALAAAGFTHQGDGLPGLDLQIEMGEHLLPILVAERHVPEAHVSMQLGPVFALGVKIIPKYRHNLR